MRLRLWNSRNSVNNNPNRSRFPTGMDRNLYIYRNLSFFGNYNYKKTEIRKFTWMKKSFKVFRAEDCRVFSKYLRKKFRRVYNGETDLIMITCRQSSLATQLPQWVNSVSTSSSSYQLGMCCVDFAFCNNLIWSYIISKKTVFKKN